MALAATAVVAGVGVGIVGVGVALDSAVVALAGLAAILVGIAVCGWELLHVATYSAEYLYTGGVVRQRRLKLQALAWPDVREVLVWVGEGFMPGQVLAYYVVSAAGRKLRVESLPKAAIGDRVAAAARAHGIDVVETTDSPEPLWSL